MTQAGYLGATVASRDYGVPTAPGWSKQAINAVANHTWRRYDTRLYERAETIGVANSSPGHKAYVWNTYVVSLVPYPAQICGPPAMVARHFHEAMAKAFSD